jgi:hypothetical protein
MIYLACADIHISEHKPRYRKDDYFAASCEKLKWAISQANEHEAQLIIAGDLFDSSKASVYVLNTVMGIIQAADKEPIVIAGQHDLRYHTSLEKTPIYNLALSGDITLLISDSMKFHTSTGTSIISGYSWEKEPQDPNFHTDILMLHHCCTPEEPPFFLEDATSAADLSKMYPNAKYIVCGDYHIPHHTGNVINCGTFMRNKKDMLDHQPYVWLIDTDKDEVKKIKVPIAPADEVFDIEAIAYDEEHGITVDTEKLKELMDGALETVDLKNVVFSIYSKMKKKDKPSKQLVEEVLNAIST